MTSGNLIMGTSNSMEKGVLLAGGNESMCDEASNGRTSSLCLKNCISDGPLSLCRWISSPADCGGEVVVLDMRLASP